jgi:hypothetical protein
MLATRTRMHHAICLMLALSMSSAQWTLNNPWQSLPNVPDALGETAAALINGNILLFGQQTPKTYQFNLASQSWSTNRAQRPLPGDHHAVIVPGDGTLWLIGGFDGGSQGKVGAFAAGPPYHADSGLRHRA